MKLLTLEDYQKQEKHSASNIFMLQKNLEKMPRQKTF